MPKDDNTMVLSSFGKIIPKEVLSHPNITPLNIHFSILPLYRGASPIQSSLLNGDIKTGISFMEMVESLDEGPVYDVSEVEISDSDNRISLEKKLVAKAFATSFFSRLILLSLSEISTSETS